MIFGNLPYVKIALNLDANSATDVCVDTLRLMDGVVKTRRKVVERIDGFVEGDNTIGLCVPRLPSEKVHSAESWKIGRRESFKSANLRSEIHGLQNSMKERKTKP